MNLGTSIQISSRGQELLNLDTKIPNMLLFDFRYLVTSLNPRMCPVLLHSLPRGFCRTRVYLPATNLAAVANTRRRYYELTQGRKNESLMINEAVFKGASSFPSGAQLTTPFVLSILLTLCHSFEHPCGPPEIRYFPIRYSDPPWSILLGKASVSQQQSSSFLSST